MNAEEDDHDIVVKLTRNFEGIEFSSEKLEELVKLVCTRFGPARETKTAYEVSIAVVDDEEIRKLNKSFGEIDSVTDCLSFDLSEADKDLPRLFEVVVNGEKAVREAENRGHSPEAELSLYVTHSLLHNLGFDDSGPDQAEKMHDTEDEILQELGFGLVYSKNKRA
ncbi:rRNA maturation RNase YbeY [Planctomycetota bacterium]